MTSAEVKLTDDIQEQIVKEIKLFWNNSPLSILQKLKSSIQISFHKSNNFGQKETKNLGFQVYCGIKDANLVPSLAKRNVVDVIQRILSEGHQKDGNKILNLLIFTRYSFNQPDAWYVGHIYRFD